MDAFRPREPTVNPNAEAADVKMAREDLEYKKMFFSLKPMSDSQVNKSRAIEEKWDQVQSTLRELVVAYQTRPNTPPSSPPKPSTDSTRPKAIMKVSRFEQVFQNKFREFNNQSVPPGGERKPIWEFFELEDIPSNYDPKFDRNDLPFTNHDEAKRLIALFKPRGYDGTSLNLRIECIEHTDIRGKVKKYVTFCTHSERDMFLENVLNGVIICSDLVTNFIHEKSLEEGGGTGWKWRFRLTNLKDTMGPMQFVNLPNLLDALSVEIFDQMSRYPNGLNSAEVTFGRHLLIMEAGSVDVYRSIAAFKIIDKEFSKVIESSSTMSRIKDAMKAAGLFYKELHESLPTAEFGKKFSYSCEILSSRFQEAQTIYRDVMKKWRRLQSASEHLCTELQKMKMISDYDMLQPKKLMYLLQTFKEVTPSTKLNTFEVQFNLLKEQHDKIVSVTGQFDSNTVGAIIQSVATLEIWTATPLPSALRKDPFASHEWPLLPPKLCELNKVMIDKKYHELSLKYHPDRNRTADAPRKMAMLTDAKLHLLSFI